MTTNPPKVCDCIYGDGACKEHSDEALPVTTIDERLVKVIRKAIDDNQYIDGDTWHMPEDALDEAKAAIKSLFLDLIAEAKPANYRHEGNASNLTTNTTGLDTVSSTLDQYETNLKQAIDGGKK